MKRNNSVSSSIGLKYRGKTNIRNASNRFAFKLFKVFASRHKTDSKNMCFSPFEVFTSLVMLLLGARGTTEVQLEDMLCLSNFNNPEKYDELKDLLRYVIQSNYEIMLYGTVIYVDHRIHLRQDYVEKLRTLFEMKPKPMDFSNVNAAAAQINKDASELTDGVVEDVITARELQEDANVKLVILNAVFFRGYWLFKFGEYKKDKFYYAKGKKEEMIDLMSHVGNHRYLFDTELQAHAVSLAYSASDMRMVILLPDDTNSEAVNLVEMLDANRMSHLFWRLQHNPKSLTELTIPRFGLDAHKVSLQKSVKQMGAKSLYDPRTATLSGMCTNDRIHLTKLVHKAFILVDERGAQTFSLQNKTDEVRCMIQNGGPAAIAEARTKIPMTFKANHPFVYLILDKITGVICFMGVFADPTTILQVVNEQELSKEEITELLANNDMQEY